jgi:NADH-quinone oxidoreductase subunit L
MQFLSICTVFLPLIASVLVGLTTRIISFRLSEIISVGAILVATIFSAILFYDVIFLHNIVHVKLLRWIDVSHFQADWSIYVDSLTALMLFVVTFVSCLVHIYSTGYMSEDRHKQRFMAYLSLFTFCMLMLVTSDNLLQLFLGWEGVGLSSFLIIGFWFKKNSASNAALKAFLVNRLGDIGLALSILLIAITFESLEYSKIFANLDAHDGVYQHVYGIDFSVIDIICILMIIGCIGKSAQIGLHVWLPDAMEGPTPASALIHAATMVTAGVFLIARCSFIFEHSQLALDIVIVFGALTCLFTASIATVQNDIKKIIAYSTCSQLGYMFFACGVHAYSAAMFHLMTHAFFKALLFLGAGSVINAIDHEQNIKKMGCLYKVLPVTYTFMIIGSLALCGVFPFAGYFSKDLILEHAYLVNTTLGDIAYCAGLFAAFLTAFYTFRLIILVFHRKSKLSSASLKCVHEPSKSMLIPMSLLALGATISGYIGVDILKISSPSSAFWNGALVKDALNSKIDLLHLHGVMSILPSIAAIIGFTLALVIYLTKINITTFFTNHFNFVYKVIVNKYYFDELYDRIFVTKIKKLSISLWKIFDNSVIDGVPNGLAIAVFGVSKMSRYLQTGSVYNYSFFMFIGVLAIICMVIF